MGRQLKQISVALAVLLFGSCAAHAQADVIMSPNSRRAVLIDEYTAFIGRDDLFSSNGEPLSRPWQVLRQDRANFHLYDIRQRGDQGDVFFASKGNRAKLEAMIAAGRMSREAASVILAGGALVHVEIWGREDTGDYVLVQVE